MQGRQAVRLGARLGLRHALVLRGRDLDRRGHHRLGRVLRAVRRRQDLHRDPVQGARGRPRPVRRRGDLGGPLQSHQGLRHDRHGDLGHLRHRHRAVGHHGPRRRQAGAQADRRRLSQRGHSLRHRPLLHRHGSAGRGGGRRGAGVQERRLSRHQDEDRPGRPQARCQARRRGAPGDRARHQARGRRQPLLLGAQRHQARPHAGGARHPVVRGADQPGGP